MTFCTLTSMTIHTKKSVSPQSAFSTVRVLSGFICCAIGAGLAVFSFAVNPPEATITPSSADVTWTGTGTGVPPAAGGEVDCEEGANCDTFKLIISGTPADWIGKQVKVRIQWLANSTDYDLKIHKGSADGPEVGSSGNAASTYEEAVLNPASAIQAQAPTLAPPRDEESALLASLPTGQYTAIVEGKGTTGTATVEVYALTPP